MPERPPGEQRDREPELARPAREGPRPDEAQREERLPEHVMQRKLTREPPRRKAQEGQLRSPEEWAIHVVGKPRPP